MKKYVFACQKCGAFYTGEGGALDHRCECGEILDVLEIPYAEWTSMSKEKQAQFKKEYRAARGIEPKGAGVAPKYEPIPESGWVSWLGCCGWLIVGAGAITTVVAIAGGGLLLVPVVILAAVMSASGFMVLREVARDTRQNRNTLNRQTLAIGKLEQELKELKQMLREKQENAENEN